MANGSDPPVPELTLEMWNRIKVLKWKDGGWVENGVTKWLHPSRKSINFDHWLSLSDTDGVLLRLYMTESDFNLLKSWTFNENLEAFVDGSGKKYRLAWGYNPTLKKFCIYPVEVQL